MSSDQKLRVAFIHPDLGIGGAEQLIINFALALQKKGHFIKIYTPYHDIDHCFKETRDGTLPVEVRGNLFPREILGKFTAFCAIIRMILATLYVIFYGGKYDIVIVD
jgi:alpha-1,3/alpha-1,6-mannosyltransferase